MKNLNRYRNQILFGFLILFLGLSKSWFMTAAPATGINLASDAPDTSAADSSAPDASDDSDSSAPKKKDHTGKKATRQSGVTTGTAKPKVSNQAVTQRCVKGPKACPQTQQAAAKKQPKKPAETLGSGVDKNKLAGAKQKTESKVPVAKADVPSITVAQGEALAQKAGPSLVGTTVKGNYGGTTFNYQIVSLSAQPIAGGQSIVNGAIVSNPNASQISATIRCTDCGDTQVIPLSSADNGGAITEITNFLLKKAKDTEDAKKQAKALAESQKNCEKDADGKRMNDRDQLVCLTHRDATDDDASSREKVENLEADIGSTLMDKIQDGPEGLAEAKRDLRAIRSEAGYNSSTKTYINKFMKFADTYGQETDLARTMALSNNPMVRQSLASQINTLEIPFMTDPSQQSYMNEFRNTLMTYGSQAATNPYLAYNSFFNGVGGASPQGTPYTGVFGSTGMPGMPGMNGANGLGGINGLNGVGGLGGSAPMGFQPTGYGPGGITGAPVGYGYNSMLNSSMLNSSMPLSMRQSTRTQQFGPGYVNGGTQSLF